MLAKWLVVMAIVVIVAALLFARSYLSGNQSIIQSSTINKVVNVSNSLPTTTSSSSTLSSFTSSVFSTYVTSIRTNSSYNQSNSNSPHRCINSSTALFTYQFTNASMIKFVYPLGGIGTGSPARSYVFVKPAQNGSFVYVPVYAPINMMLTGIAYKNPRPDYRLEFQVTCNIQLTFDHITTVANWIKSVAPPKPSNVSNMVTYLSIPVKSGQLLGYTNGTLLAGSWDFMVLNYSKPAFHINASRWPSNSQYLYGVCPYDYFTNTLKTTYYSLLAASGSQFNPLCGRVSRDVLGTMSGAWFLGNSTVSKGSWLMIGSFLNYVGIVLRQGSRGVVQSVYAYGAPDPATFNVGSSYCYTGGSSYYYLKLISNLTMQAIYGNGSCPAQFPTAGYQTWAR